MDKLFMVEIYEKPGNALPKETIHFRAENQEKAILIARSQFPSARMTIWELGLVAVSYGSEIFQFE